MQISVNKIDVARRQLESAIQLFFADGDPIPIHTLGAAAYNVIRDLNTRRGGPPMLGKDLFPALFGGADEEHERFLRDELNRPENFFKHADRDPKDSLVFDSELTEFLLLDACDSFRVLTGNSSAPLTVLRLWMVVHHPTIFRVPAELEGGQNELSARFGELNKSEFYNRIECLAPKIGLSELSGVQRMDSHAVSHSR